MNENQTKIGDPALEHLHADATGADTSTTSEPLLSGVYPEKLAARERLLVENRRREFSGSEGPVTGLALSGGGIRSATFCLGFMQALARAKLLQRVDFLSTVSGGGYAGSFLGAWIKREGAAEVQRKLPDSDSAPVVFLRNNGRYLAPNGGGDMMSAASTHLRSWFSMWLVLGSLVFGLLMTAEAFKAGLRHEAWQASIDLVNNFRTGVLPADTELHPTLLSQIKEHLSISPFFRVTGWLLLVLALPLGTAYWFVGSWRRLWQLWVLLLAVGGGLAALLFKGPGQEWSSLAKIAVTAAYLLTVGLAARELSRDSRNWAAAARDFTDSLSATLLLAGGLFAFAIVDTLGQSLATQPGWWVSVVVLPGLAAAAQWIMPRLAEASNKEMPAWLGSLLLPAAAVIVALLALSILSMCAHLLAGALVSSPKAAPYFFWGIVVAIVGLTIAAVIRKDALLGLSVMVLVGLVAACTLLPHGYALKVVTTALVIGVTALGILLFAYLLGINVGFVNASSHHRLYAARLTRAYIGASNLWRTDPERAAKLESESNKGFDPADIGATGDVTQAVLGDQIEFLDYNPHQRGGPLHLINTTVNETVSGISNIEYRDRRGYSLAVGPAGLSTRTTDHALFDAGKGPSLAGYATLCGGLARDKYHTLAIKTADHIHAEMPSLGAWVGISGAAFTTGLGARTNLAFSFLLGFFNVRLGYWWDSGVRPRLRAGVAQRKKITQLGDGLSRLFRAQSGLLDEFLARFRGPARRHWYLSDGGHFENCAVYELIRRRVPLIVCCDCGADPDYQFEDVANLVRKARVDFDAEIEFLSPAQLATELGLKNVQELAAKYPRLAATVGLPEELKPEAEGAQKGFSPKNAAIARVTYEGAAERSLLVIVKPTLGIDAPVDLKHYDATESAFPQQTTLDQFFDESQWESYRKLGDFIGGKLFGGNPDGRSPEWDALAALADKYCPRAKALQKIESAASA